MIQHILKLWVKRIKIPLFMDKKLKTSIFAHNIHILVTFNWNALINYIGCVGTIRVAFTSRSCFHWRPFKTSQNSWAAVLVSDLTSMSSYVVAKLSTFCKCVLDFFYPYTDFRRDIVLLVSCKLTFFRFTIRVYGYPYTYSRQGKFLSDSILLTFLRSFMRAWNYPCSIPRQGIRLNSVKLTFYYDLFECMKFPYSTN